MGGQFARSEVQHKVQLACWPTAQPDTCGGHTCRGLDFSIFLMGDFSHALLAFLLIGWCILCTQGLWGLAYMGVLVGHRYYFGNANVIG